MRFPFHFSALIGTSRISTSTKRRHDVRSVNPFYSNTKLPPLSIALLAVFSSSAWAQNGASPAEVVMPEVAVIGKTENLPSIAGAGEVLDRKTLEGSRVFTVNEALRKVAGVNVRDEEGFGLRPNIGMRGLNPTRSTKVTLLEDGIPLAYAPYGDNASYYHPNVDRFDRIEVLKGAGALMFGPQTVAGVINYITAPPPAARGGYLQGTFGNRDYFNGKVRFGGGGAVVDYSHKRGNGARENNEHKIDDFNAKYVLGIGSNQGLTLRANYQGEDSKITYSGLTQAEFDKLGPRYNPFRNDKFKAGRTGVSATHEIEFASGGSLQTNAYYSKFDRDWWRQASNSQDSQCGTGFNSARLAGSIVNPDLCNSVQGRLRSYETWGIEPRLTVAHRMGELQAGVRAHFEQQNRRQINGAIPAARTGTLAENNLRDTTAYSMFVANRFNIGQLDVTPIIRHERIYAERMNRITGAKGETSVNAWMPGVGVTWNPSSRLTMFSSLHKGFAPPRVEDLVGNTGTVTDVPEERSINFEVGVRSELRTGTNVQAAYFRNNYRNLIAVGSIAGGSTPLSNGRALFSGMEMSVQSHLGNGVIGRFAYTWLPVAEQEEAFRNVATGAVIAGSTAGKRQPYAPKHTLTLAGGYEISSFRGELEAQYVGEQYSDFSNTIVPAANGQSGQIESYTALNLSLNYQFDQTMTAFLTVKNLADKTYIVDRTRGILTGMPRLVQVGLRYNF